MQLTQALGAAQVALLVCRRVAPACGDCFSADPASQSATGWPRRQGHKLGAAHPTTWPTPEGEQSRRAVYRNTPASHRRSGSGGMPLVVGPGVPHLDCVWWAYVPRFDVEHTSHFLKQTLNWTLPRVRHPEQADR